MTLYVILIFCKLFLLNTGTIKFLIGDSAQWGTNLLDGWMFEVKLSMSLFSYPEKASLSEGLDVSGNLLRFFWLNSGTDRQPVPKKKICEM